MRSLRNILGENDEPLTILSLLPRLTDPGPDGGWEVPADQLASLLCSLGGDDGEALGVVTVRQDGIVTSTARQPLTEVARRLQAVAEADGATSARLSYLRREDWDDGGEPDDPETRRALEDLFDGGDGAPVAVLTVALHRPPG